MKRWIVAMVWAQVDGPPLPTIEIVEAETAKEAVDKAGRVYEFPGDWPDWEIVVEGPQELPEKQETWLIIGPDIFCTTKAL